MKAELVYEDGELYLYSRYNPGLVQEIKSLPFQSRKWDAGRKAWAISSLFAENVVAMIEKYFGETIAIPPSPNAPKGKETRILEIRYLGTCKERQAGTEPTAFGLHNGEWSVIFPESTLTLFFTGTTRSRQDTGYYATLGIHQYGSTEEIRKSFRRLAMQWHPDHCSEPDAAEVFMKIKKAYDCLIDPRTRARYDAGLRLQDTLTQDTNMKFGYRSPLRCGLIVAEGIEELGRFTVSNILQWEDITDHYGRTLVVSWPYGAKAPTERWVSS